MKKNRFEGGLFLLCAVLCLTGCLEKHYADVEAEISVDRQTLTVPADDPKGVDAVKDTIWVDANRSWSAVFEEEVDWVRIDELNDGHVNLNRIGDKSPIALSFKDNPDKASRSVNLKICSEAGQKVVSIVQELLVNRLSIDNVAGEFSNLDYVEGIYKLKINTNCTWTISVKEGSGIQFEIPVTSGERSAVVDIKVKENPDQKPKTGVLVISAPECDTIELPVSQLAAKPYLKFPDGQSSFAALDGFDNFDIPVISNANWSASIESVEGFKEGAVSTTASGDKTSTTAHVDFPALIDFSVKKGVITVKFTVEGAAEPVYATITQVPAIALAFGDPHSAGMHVKDMNIWNSSNADEVAVAKSYFPFSKMEKQNASGVWEPCYTGDLFTWLKSTRLANDPSVIRWTLNNGYVMYTLTQTKGYQVHNKNGWSWGAVVGDYFTSPVVEGHRLSRVVYTHETSTVNLQIKDKFDTNFGSVLKPAKTDPADLTIDMKDSQSDMEYKFVLTSTYWFRIGQILFYYE